MSASFSGRDVCLATGAECLPGSELLMFRAVTTDSRAVEADNLFVALRGENFDGHRFIGEAITRGASGVVVSQHPETAENFSCPVFVVSNTLQAFQGLARLHRDRFSYPVVAITGSNGKTSTKDLVASVLTEKLRVLKTEANFNNEIGLPKTLLQMGESHEVAVVEMGMRGLGEIAALTDIAHPTIGVVTNVGETHMERLGSMENIAAAKNELISALPTSGLAVLNGDDARVRAMQQKTKARVITFGVDSHNAVRATEIQLAQDSVSFVCELVESSFSVQLPVPGIHNVYNALATIAVGQALGLSNVQMVRGFARFSPGKMRLHIRQIGDVTVIDDTYNASPLSMAAAIDVLHTFAGKRRVAVIGDMLELGSTGEAAHKKVGEQLARVGTELVISVGPLARLALETAGAFGVPMVFACGTHTEAGELLLSQKMAGDVILFKGSRGMRMEEVLHILELAAEGRR